MFLRVAICKLYLSKRADKIKSSTKELAAAPDAKVDETHKTFISPTPDLNRATRLRNKFQKIAYHKGEKISTAEKIQEQHSKT